jgi:hypothetical protein
MASAGNIASAMRAAAARSRRFASQEAVEVAPMAPQMNASSDDTANVCIGGGVDVARRPARPDLAGEFIPRRRA